MVRKKFDVSDNWVLNAQMPFGGLANNPEIKPEENVMQRIRIIK